MSTLTVLLIMSSYDSGVSSTRTRERASQLARTRHEYYVPSVSMYT